MVPVAARLDDPSQERKDSGPIQPSLFDPPAWDDEVDAAFGSQPVLVDLQGVRLERARDFGDIWLAWGLWRLLGLDTLLAQEMPRGRAEVPWHLVAAILAIAAAVKPSACAA